MIMIRTITIIAYISILENVIYIYIISYWCFFSFSYAVNTYVGVFFSLQEVGDSNTKKLVARS